MEKMLVTGCAGFIGFHVAQRLLQMGYEVFGIDNLSDFYDVNLKKARLQQLTKQAHFRFMKLCLTDRQGTAGLFASEKFDKVVHLAAQAGVRYSLTHPHAYVDANVVGFLNVLEGCRAQGVKHLVFASSSSVYGANTRMPFSVHHHVDHPVSVYAATKKANELMAHAYASLYALPCSGIRFFTVYGPWGRPDMALFLFTKAILEGTPIDVFNFGKMQRDFTYIDDAVEGVVRIANAIPRGNPAWNGDEPDCGSSSAPYRIYNLGNNKPTDLLTVIRVLEERLGRKAKLNLLPLQPGDVPATCADIEDVVREFGFTPKTSLEEGIRRFLEWYREYYKV